MGTWSAAILGNDTSAETHESFMRLYDDGVAVARIVQTIERQMKRSLRTREDRTNVELRRGRREVRMLPRCGRASACSTAFSSA